MDQLQVVSEYQSGLPAPKIAQLYGVSYQWIQQILKKHNVSRTDGGSHVRHQTFVELVNVARNTRCLEKNGCTYEQYKTIPFAEQEPVEYYRLKSIAAAAQNLLECVYRHFMIRTLCAGLVYQTQVMQSYGLRH